MKPKVTRVDCDEAFREVRVEVDFDGVHFFCTTVLSRPRPGEWTPARIGIGAVAPRTPEEGEVCAQAILFACQIARRLDAGEEVRKGEECEGGPPEGGEQTPRQSA